MNTVSASKGIGHRLGLGEALLFAGGLIVVGAILAAVLFVSAQGAAAPAAVEQTEIYPADFLRAYERHRNSEWGMTQTSPANGLPSEQFESGQGAGKNCDALPTKTAQAMCLGIR